MRNTIGSFVVLLAILSAGCGDGRRQVSGKLLRGGQPLTVTPEKGMIALGFIPADDKDGNQLFNATTKPDGTFTIIGPASKGIPPGKYRIKLTVMDPYTGPASKDILGNRFAKGDNSSLIVEVGAGEVVVDVPK
jgi:hypothetical protein